MGKPNEGEIETICESAIDALQDLDSGPIGIEDTLRECFENELSFIADLQRYLLKWAKQIRLNKATPKCSALINNTDDLFLTFNYTPTLERIYGIGTSQICHIHGGIPPYCSSDPVLGHGNKAEIARRQQWKQECDDSFDEAGSSKNQAYVDFYRRTLKDTGKTISLNSMFFQRLNDVEEIDVIGLSLGAVDMPYFEEVLRCVGETVPWKVFYYDETAKDSMEKRLCGIGVAEIEMIPSEKFWTAENNNERTGL